MEQKYLYVVFSSTPYKIGKVIRTLTHTKYNHVSLSFDPELHTMYGFARRFYRTAFYGGFVVEYPCRHQLGGSCSQIKVCKVPVSAKAYDKLQKKFEQMAAHKERYLYNHLSVLGVPFQKRIHVKDAYMCVEFCMDTLKEAGLPIESGKYYSIKQAEQILQPYVVYIGPMKQDKRRDPVFFLRRPLPHPVWSSVVSIAALLPRLQKNFNIYQED